MTPIRFEPSADPPVPGATARLTLDHPLFGQRAYKVTFEVCPNPACHCAGVTFNCNPVGAQTESAATEPIEFSLDVQCRALLGEDGSPASGALGESVAAGLDETGWNWLLGFFVNTKRAQMETVDLDDVDFVLPADLQTGQTTMLAYSEVFPWADSILLTLGPDRWLIDDQFCVRPGCTCTDAVLLFLRLPKTDDRPPRKQQKPGAALRFDYLRGAATEILKSTRNAPSPAQLIDAAVAAHGTLADTFRRRHQQLKYLYERHPKRYPDPAVSPDASGAGIKVQPEPSPGAATEPARPASRSKVGRNAPCPCGSGRKYKKCCGASLR